MALGTAYAFSYPHPTDGVAVDVIAPAQTLYCFGAVLILLRFNPSFDWLARIPWLERLVAAINARAVTIYLWNSLAVVIAGTAVSDVYGGVPTDLQGIINDPTFYLLTWVVLGVAVLAFGWVEDLAARRKPHIVPEVLIRKIPAPALDQSGIDGHRELETTELPQPAESVASKSELT